MGLFFLFIFDFFIQVYKSDLESGLPLLSCYFRQLNIAGENNIFTTHNIITEELLCGTDCQLQCNKQLLK